MKIECPRCGEKVEYSPGAVQTCSYCQVRLQMPAAAQLPEDLRTQWFRELAAAKAKEEKLRKKQEADERRRKQKELRDARQREIAVQRNASQPLSAKTLQPSATGSSVFPNGRTLRSRSLADRAVYLFDPKFERYITPDIISLFWVLCLILALLGVAIFALGTLRIALPQETSVPVVRPDEVVYREGTLTDLIAEGEFEKMMAESRETETPEEPQVRPVAAQKRPKFDPDAIRAEYSKLSLDQLRAELTKLEKAHPSSRTEWVYSHCFLYPLWIAAALVATVLCLLIIRMACEFLCVIFNIATHLKELREALPATVRG